MIILNKDTSILIPINNKAGNIGNCVCDVVSSTFFGAGDVKRITTIPNFKIGKKYIQQSVMVPMGYGVNWEIVSTKEIE